MCMEGMEESPPSSPLNLSDLVSEEYANSDRAHEPSSDSSSISDLNNDPGVQYYDNIGNYWHVKLISKCNHVQAVIFSIQVKCRKQNIGMKVTLSLKKIFKNVLLLLKMSSPFYSTHKPRDWIASERL